MSKSGSEVTLSKDGPKTKKRRFDKRDFLYIADYVIQEYTRRKTERGDLEKYWADIDRQLEMKPSLTHKLGPMGQVDDGKMWMSEMELPFQAQTLEVLSAETRSMMFPDGANWFGAVANVTDKYLQGVELSTLVAGDENEVPSLITQDNANKLVEGFLLEIFKETNQARMLDAINSEAIKYGMGVGRKVNMTKNVFINDSTGVIKKVKKFPLLAATSIKKTYLDDRPPSPHSSQVLGEAHIYEDSIRLDNLKMAAKNGSSDPSKENGGWMTDFLNTVTPDNSGYVTILEMEGDIVIPRKTTRDFVLTGVIVTVIKGDEGTKGVCRFRWRKEPQSTYCLFPYHSEHINSPYPTSPLMKGRTVQIAAVDALNRLMDSAALKNSPPISYDRNDMVFNQDGGPMVFPGAMWGSTENIIVHNSIGGDPSVLSGIFSSLVNLYAELTGMLPARLGAQTVSHTTAFAKDAELQKGAVRTVDYVNSVGHSSIINWLSYAYRTARSNLGDSKVDMYIKPYDSYVKMSKDALPEDVTFNFLGSGGPGEEQQKKQMRFQSAQTALQIDQLEVSQGKQELINKPALVKQILREGNWTDVEAIVNPEGLTDAGESAPGTGGTIEPNAGATTAAIQGISFAR